MKLVSALVTCLAVVAARRRNLSDTLFAKINGPDGIRRQEEARIAKIEKQAEAQRQALARQQRSEQPGVVEVGAVTPDNEDLVIHNQEMNDVTSRIPSVASPQISNAVSKTDDWELRILFDRYFFDADQMINIHNYAGMKVQKAIVEDISQSKSKLSRVATALATGAPAIKFSEVSLRPISSKAEAREFKALTHEYSNFMQFCEEDFTAIFQTLYRIFWMTLDAAKYVGTQGNFLSYDDVSKTQVLVAVQRDLEKAGKYIEEIINLTNTSNIRALGLRNKMQKTLEDKAEQLQVKRLSQRAHGHVSKDLATANDAMDALSKQKADLEQEQTRIADIIAQLDKDMNDASAELKKALQDRSKLVSNITPEKREGSPSHWRMFYEELCGWFVEWDCKFDATQVFQWVVDPTVIKKQYVSATEHINKLTTLNEQRQEQKIEQLRLQNLNAKMILDFAKQAGDALYAVADIGYDDLEANYVGIYQTAMNYLEKVSNTFAEIATEFKDWNGNIQGTLLKQETLMTKLTEMTSENPLGVKNTGIMQGTSYKMLKDTTMMIIFDCVKKGLQAYYCADDIEYYRGYNLEYIPTMTEDELLVHISEKDLDLTSQAMKDHIQSERLSYELKKQAAIDLEYKTLGKLQQV